MIRIILAVALALCFIPSDALAMQLLVSAVGGALGFLIGGPVGFAVGWAAGSFLGGLFFGPKGPTIRGPRLADKTVQSSAYGAHIIKHWGTDRLPAQLIFSSGLKETQRSTEVGGKGIGGGGATQITYTYSVDLMLSFGRQAKGIKRLWADTKLIIDHTGEVTLQRRWAREGRRFVVRDGNEAQLPSALEESYHGVGECSAHRGLFCLEAEDFQLADFANRIPNFTAEVYTEGDLGYIKIASYVAPAAPYSWWVGSWGYIDPNGEVWALYYPYATMWPYDGYANIFHWTLDRPTDPIVESHPLWTGSVVQGSSIANYIRVRSIEPSAAVFGTNNLGISFSYFRLSDGTRIDVLDSELIPGADFYPGIVVNNGESLYALYQGGWVQPGMLYRFDLSGTYQASSTVIYDAGAVDCEMGFSDSYLWAMVNPAQLLKIDPDSLALISNVNITGTTGQLLAMAVISDTEIRVVTASDSGVRFYIVNPDTGAATLDKIATDETYSGIRGFGRWGLRYEGGMYIVDFGGWIGGFEALIDFYGEAPPTEDIPLWKIVRDINIMAGLDSEVDTAPPTVGEIEVSELLDMVHGYSLTRPMTARDALEQLQQTYFFDGREKDGKLDYPKRGKAVVRSIPGTDLAARSALTEALPDRLTQMRARESELPLRVHVIFNNHENAYQQGHEYAPRQITDARSTMSAEIAVAITSTEARKVAETLLMLAWLERESFSARASRKHFRIDAADNVEIVITEEL